MRAWIPLRPADLTEPLRISHRSENMRPLPALFPRLHSRSASLQQRAFTLLETLVALALLVILTMVVAAIFKHHTSAPPTAESSKNTPTLQPVREAASDTPPLRTPTDLLAPSPQ